MGVLLILSGCISIPEEEKAKLREATGSMAKEVREDKNYLCQKLISEHGWKQTANGCTKKR